MATAFENNTCKPNFESVYQCKRSGEKHQGLSTYTHTHTHTLTHKHMSCIVLEFGLYRK